MTGARLAARTWGWRSLRPCLRAKAPAITIALCISLVPVGWITFLGYTVVSTVTRSMS